MAPTKPLLKNGFQWPVFAPAKPAYMPFLAITPDQVRIIASIEDPAVIRTLLAYLNKKWVMAGGRDFYAQTSAWSQHRWVKRQIPAFNRQIARPFAESQAID